MLPTASLQLGDEPLLTPREMAVQLHVPLKTLYYWVGRLEIPFLKVGRHLRFRRDEVLQFFQMKTEAGLPCLGKSTLIQPNTTNGRNSSSGSLKIRSGNLAET